MPKTDTDTAVPAPRRTPAQIVSRFLDMSEKERVKLARLFEDALGNLNAA